LSTQKQELLRSNDGAISLANPLPYCGGAPIPGALIDRFNLDPIVIGTLLLACALQCIALGRNPGRYCVLGGWLIAATAFLSPLCALSVSLFSARVAQHMILILVAAPLIALGLPRIHRSTSALPLWSATIAFLTFLWTWHMPVPYAATFASVPVYWAMHLTLFGSAIWLWRELLQHSIDQTGAALAAGAVTFVQMGLLGAVLTFADHPMFRWNLGSTQAWGFSPLQDQELGGIFMWVPGSALILWVAMRSVLRLWNSIERTRPV
jgi:putative membrane protein